MTEEEHQTTAEKIADMTAMGLAIAAMVVVIIIGAWLFAH